MAATHPFTTEYREICGQRQFLLHYPAAGNAPVLLFLHGGPGVAESNLGYLYRQCWGELFTVVHWDQPAAGKTYAQNKGHKPDVAELRESLRQVVTYLKEKYAVPKIVLMGHSWGTLLGSLYAQERPEELLLYIGVGQLTGFRENEACAYAELLSRLCEAGDSAALSKLEAIGEYPPENLHTDEFWRRKKILNGLMARRGMVMKMTLPLLRAYIKSPMFRLSDTAMLRGKLLASNERLRDWMMDFDITACGTRFEVPICCIMGENDWQTAVPPVEAWLSRISAPQKQLHLIADAGHNPMFDAPEGFTAALAAARAMIPENP